MKYNQDLLEIAELLKSICITNDQITRLHHFSLKGRRETTNSTIRWISKSQGSDVSGANISYYNRLHFIAGRLKNGDIKDSVPDEFIDEAIRRFPLG